MLSTEYLSVFFMQLALFQNYNVGCSSPMLSTSKIVLFPGHNHLLTNNADDPTL